MEKIYGRIVVITVVDDKLAEIYTMISTEN